jgi:hypothetical protein
VTKIWDQAPHNAFTDLARHDGRWHVAFREGSAHVSPDGKIRVIRSKKGVQWEPWLLLERAGDDLRDPKLSVNPNGDLVLLAAAARPSGHQTMMWTLPNAVPKPVADLNYWLWRIAWRGREAFGIGYRTSKDQRGVRLYKFNGAEFVSWVDDLNVDGYPNESAIRFRGDGTAIALLRRDPGNGMVGVAKPPYREWTWHETNARVGGPNFIALPDGRFVAAVRLYDGAQRTSLCWFEPEKAALTEFLKLPSSGDSSYAGMAVDGRELLVSYYSSHEGKTAIYLARVNWK